MWSRLRTHLTYANVVASLALFIALGGSAVAAVKLSKGSVSSRELHDRGVKGTDLATGAVDSRVLKDGSITASDLSGSGRAALIGPKGATGATGATGPKGDTGQTGATGSSGAVLVASQDFGPFSVSSPTIQLAESGEIDWTQPAGTFEEFRGYVDIGASPGCSAPEVGIQVVLDGKEISSDPDNGPADPIAESYFPGSQELKIERAAEPQNVPTEHTLTVRYQDKSTCPNPTPVPSLRVYVLRYGS